MKAAHRLRAREVCTKATHMHARRSGRWERTLWRQLEMRDCMRGMMQAGQSVTSANSTAAAVCSGSANSNGDRPASISYAKQPICAYRACQPWCGVRCICSVNSAMS